MKIINCSKDKKLIILMVFSYFFSPFLRAQGMAYSINVVEECIKAANESNESMSNKVLKFAKKNRGRRVGRGECWDLVYEALKQNGGKTPVLNKEEEDLYKWSSDIVTEKNNLNIQLIKPGDIIQFLNNNSVGFSFTNEIEIIFKITSNCKPYALQLQGQSWGSPYHTAVIEKIIDIETGTLLVWEQWKGVPVKTSYISLIDHIIYVNGDDKLNLNISSNSLYKDKKKYVVQVGTQLIDKSKIQNDCGIIISISNTGSGNFIIYRPQEK